MRVIRRQALSVLIGWAGRATSHPAGPDRRHRPGSASRPSPLGSALTGCQPPAGRRLAGSRCHPRCRQMCRLCLGCHLLSVWEVRQQGLHGLLLLGRLGRGSGGAVGSPACCRLTPASWACFGCHRRLCGDLAALHQSFDGAAKVMMTLSVRFACKQLQYEAATGKVPHADRFAVLSGGSAIQIVC